MAVAEYLTQLQADKQTLVDNLVAKGVEATSDETFTTLVPKVADIQSGGSTVTKGLVINSYDEDGYATDVSLVGMTEIPNYYFYYTMYKNGNKEGLLSRAGANLHLPEELTSIGNSAFDECTNLALMSLPKGITSIGTYAFRRCSNLVLTELPSGITSIETYSFYNCTNLALMSLPKGIISIGTYAFYGCPNLNLTELPSGITSIGTYSFYNCTNIKLKELPVGITKLDGYNFRYCYGITEMTIQGDITVIGTQCFTDCKNLEKIVLPNVTSVPTLSNTNAFNNTPIANGTGYIYVPNDLVDSFKTATNWSTYANQIKGVSELV